MIICNDIMAYMFGFFFGKTPLIKLSPKKTWEGFIGGAISTIVFGIGVSWSFWKLEFLFLMTHVGYASTPLFILLDTYFAHNLQKLWIHSLQIKWKRRSFRNTKFKNSREFEYVHERYWKMQHHSCLIVPGWASSRENLYSVIRPGKTQTGLHSHRS